MVSTCVVFFSAPNDRVDRAPLAVSKLP